MVLVGLTFQLSSLMSPTLYASNCAVYNEVAIQLGQVLQAPVYKYTPNQFEESVLKCIYLDNRTCSYEPTCEEIHAKNVLDITGFNSCHSKTKAQHLNPYPLVTIAQSTQRSQSRQMK